MNANERLPSDSTRRLAGAHVVVVVAWSVMGGAERNAVQVAERLLAEGADVRVVALTDAGGRFRDAIEAMGIEWHPHPLDWRGSRSAKARALAGLTLRLRRLAPDVLMPYCTRPNVFCGLVWRATGASTCIWNQRDVVPSSIIGRRLVSRAARATPISIANSQTAADFLVRELGAEPDRVHVIRDSVEIRPAVESRAAWRTRLGVPEDRLVVTMLSHFTRGKDHATLLRAWRDVVDRLDGRALLVLAGRAAGTEDEAKSVAFDLGLTRREVRFAGEVEDVAGLLEASDVAVLSSLSESYPNALLEAMAAGLPVAGTDIPGIREVVGPHQHRYLAPLRDAEGLARALVELLERRDVREELGRENARLIGERDREPAAPRAVELVVGALGRTRGETGGVATDAGVLARTSGR